MRTLAILLLIVAATTLAQAPQQQHGAPKPAAVASDSQGFSKERPAFIKLLPPDPSAAEDQKRAAEDKERADKIKIDQGMLQYTAEIARDTNRMFWATALMFLVTAGLFAVAAFQFAEARIAVKAATQSASAAVRAVDVAETTAERQLRAYVFTVADGPLKLDSEGRITAWLKTKNFGQTPAHALRTTTQITVEPYPPKSLQFAQLPPGSSSPLAPTEIFEHNISVPFKLNGAERAELAAKRAAIYVRSEVRYQDIFGKEHKTEVLLYCTGPDASIGALAIAEQGNSAD